MAAGKSKPTVLIAERLAPTPAEWLGQRAELIWCHGDEQTLQAHLPEADALIVRTYTQVTGDLLDQAPNLQVVGRAGVGLDNIDLEAARLRGVDVVYTPDANTQAVVEYAFSLMFDILRPRPELPPHAEAQAFHDLRRTQVGTQLEELTMGIVGFGRIGRRIGEVAYAIGMNLIVCDLLPESQVRKQVDFPFEYRDHAAVYTHSDVVTLHVDGRPGNRHMVDADALAHFRDTALLLNTSRGFVINPAALADWAREHPRGRAVLDVHDPEPPPPDYPLWDLPNVRLMPHLASRTDKAMENMSWVVHDVLAVLEGRQPVSSALEGPQNR
jgi:D-3-phosphoglycerate dehydrogenase